MNLSDVNWDINAAGTWPLPIKAVATLLVCALVAAGGVYMFTLDRLDSLDAIKLKEQELRTTFESKQKKAVNLRDYQKQLSDIESSLEVMIRQMPTEEEVASLLIDISQTGLASGLEFKLFRPSGPVKQEFYSELPISIQVIGKYEELGMFVSGLASLPRIVTVHDVNIVPYGKDGAMMMNAVVKTYNEGSTNSDGAAVNRKRG
ncbi:type 4a pilus biogenesis protein PilO [Crenothrix polyspora]|uniref:Pilus assembly protein PilO n=1 Tax=Crenothrix polyspora TaxID=360316 RepID=A0A1R4HGB0_9GAMM|nr:type 4a pilus biogenesis protein PilO [Crenothrix polyspora]SJM95272.1 Pilus assembly protein PilO [Crenothrix polyspora]